MDEDVAVQVPVDPKAARADAIRTGGRDEAPPRPPKVPLGAEMPLFCERCGYSLHALPPVRCGHCTVLQFHCPECGHHQPINTLRPAVQTMLGRLRAAAIGFGVVFRLNFFGWLLFAWAAMGVEWSYQYNYQAVAAAQVAANLRATQAARAGVVTPPPVPAVPVNPFVPRPIDLEVLAAFALFGLPFGAVGRMLLLRWRSAASVGAVLALLVALAVVVGAWFRWYEMGSDNYAVPPPFTLDLILPILLGCGCVMLGAALAWPLWVGLVRAFVPARAGAVLLDWQRSMSDPSALARP